MKTKAQTNITTAPPDQLVESARLVEEGMVHFHVHRFDEAMLAFARAIELNPQAAHAYNGMGRVYYHTGPPQQAIQAYQRATALDRHYIDAYFGLGILYAAQLGDYDAALAAFQSGLAHNPDNAFLTSSLGSTYARMGRFEEALATLQQAIHLEPDNTFAHSWLGLIALHQQRYDDVIALCLREIEIKDTDDPRRMLGYVHGWLGHNDEAIAHFEQALTFAPQDYEVRAALAKLYRIVGRYQEADAAYALAHAQAMADNEYGQACFAAVSGDVDEAVRLLQIALAQKQEPIGWVRIDPEFAFIQDDPRFQALLEDKQ